jgi:putative endonuclease
MPHYTYIVRCADKTLYTGYTNNLERRIQRHNAKRGAKYTAGRLPVKLVYFEKFAKLNTARKRETEIQGWCRENKENLIKYGRSAKK